MGSALKFNYIIVYQSTHRESDFIRAKSCKATREDFICYADLFHIHVDLIAFAVQMPYSHSLLTFFT